MNTCKKQLLKLSGKIETRSKEDMGGETGAWIAAWEVAQPSSNSLIWVGELTDMATFDALMDSDYVKIWAAENDVIGTPFSLTEIAGWWLLRSDNAGMLCWKQK